LYPGKQRVESYRQELAPAGVPMTSQPTVSRPRVEGQDGPGASCFRERLPLSCLSNSQTATARQLVTTIVPTPNGGPGDHARPGTGI
jgi:hypothetical protein